MKKTKALAAIEKKAKMTQVTVSRKKMNCLIRRVICQP